MMGNGGVGEECIRLNCRGCPNQDRKRRRERARERTRTRKEEYEGRMSGRKEGRKEWEMGTTIC